MDGRERNRALLARQLLLERSPLSPLKAVEHLVGLQAQTPRSPYTALWSRLRSFDPLTLSRLLATRRTVRIALMRSTIHLVSADDALLLRPLTMPIVMKELTAPRWARALVGVDLQRLAVLAREILEAQPHTPKNLGLALSATFPDNEPAALAHAARSLLPLVQVPPRGLWDGAGATTLTTAEHWLGRPLGESSWDAVLVRYLAAFGPATAADAVAWAKVPGMARVLDRLRPQLTVLRDERGRELFDVPQAPRPPASTPAPPRFLPDFDNVLLSHADRSHVFPNAHRAAIQTANGTVPGTLLVDGSVAAAWRVERSGTAAVLRIRQLADIPRSEHDAIRDEGLGLLSLLASDAGSRDVVLA
ncbi:winged helix DNA-binding domain-containing protein [Jatrophihabitans sp.]|uniref:winged helix DNA-binding domain-containing protein n=1 Tax=Jatrophihabitans sp. TaxID=1932789 RepID=UPI0030C74EC2